MNVILLFLFLFFFFFYSFRKWFWNSDVDPKGSYKFVLFRLAEPLFPSDIVAHVAFSLLSFFLCCLICELIH